MTIANILEWLEATPPAIWIQQSLYGFAIVVAVHILGITLSVGTLLCVDLRMLGVAFERLRVSEVYRGLAPWFLSGFAIMAASGGMLFAAFATAAYANLYFRIKMAAIVLAAVNALLFHVVTQRSSAVWDGAARPPAGVRVAGLVSLLLWGTVLVAGRMISYTMFSYPY
jgi:hypothetical protein